MTRVPRLWPESTFVCLGCGPSLIPADVEACRGRARVLAVNDAWRLAPWADVLYACDARWWRHYQGVPAFHGLKFGLEPVIYRDVQTLQDTGPEGLEVEPTGLRTGRNSGYQAINLAVHLGARRILLLGYDMQRTGGAAHFFGEHPEGLRQPSPFETFLAAFPTLLGPLATLRIDLVNCSRHTALTSVPGGVLADWLPPREACA